MRYRLPEALGGGEFEANEIWGGCAGGRPEYHLAGGVTILAPKGEPFGEVEPLLPPKPPMWSVVLDRHQRAWQHVDDGRGEWTCTVADLGAEWDELNREDGPLTLLVPDPFAEPVALPWTLKGEAVIHSVRVRVAEGSVLPDFGYGNHGTVLDPEDARSFARALWAAADEVSS